MTAHVDYYFGLTSPWSYLGHDRIAAIVDKTGATLTPFEVSFRETIFGKTGGVPVHKRAPQRQAYRLQELERWRELLGIELNLHPKHWPNDETVAANMVIVLRESGGDAIGFAGHVMRGVWVNELDIADSTTLIEIGTEAGIDAAGVMEEAANPKWASLRMQQTDEAMERGLFGAPSFCVEDQVYWGQDRLDFVERHLQRLT